MKCWGKACWAALSVVACGGAAKEAASPADTADTADETASASASPNESGGDESNVRPSAGTPAAKDGAPASEGSDDLSAVLQLVVNDPELDVYLKLGEPGRFPLKISGKAVPSDIKLVKATEPVQIVAQPGDKDPVLVFTEIEISGKKASVRYRYGAEGIRGSATLTKGQFGWELTNSRVVEHK